MKYPWTERNVASYLARYVFEKKNLVIVPNCSWPGSECDLLVVTPNLRIIDVEIKVSRADLRVDAKKNKWYHGWDWRLDGPYNTAEKRRREWPARVWKHYYCLPHDIWTPDLLAAINPVSGILLVEAVDSESRVSIFCERRAKPARGADRLTAENAVDIARLASLRMWDAYAVVDRAAANNWGGAAT